VGSIATRNVLGGSECTLRYGWFPSLLRIRRFRITRSSVSCANASNPR
jgi:hypothetical protein